jgi:hypothetical protein
MRRSTPPRLYPAATALLVNLLHKNARNQRIFVSCNGIRVLARLLDGRCDLIALFHVYSVLSLLLATFVECLSEITAFRFHERAVGLIRQLSGQPFFYQSEYLPISALLPRPLVFCETAVPQPTAALTVSMVYRQLVESARPLRPHRLVVGRAAEMRNKQWVVKMQVTGLQMMEEEREVAMCADRFDENSATPMKDLVLDGLGVRDISEVPHLSLPRYDTPRPRPPAAWGSRLLVVDDEPDRVHAYPEAENVASMGGMEKLWETIEAHWDVERPQQSAVRSVVLLFLQTPHFICSSDRLPHVAQSCRWIACAEIQELRSQSEQS